MKRNIELNTHISGKFNQELEKLTNSVLTMGGEVEQQLINTITAVRENNPSLAERVLLNDLKINSMEVQIDDECMRIIAKRNPTASDLRLIMTVSRATTDIERIGDEICRIAKLVTKDRLPPSDIVLSGMLMIAEKVVFMMRGTFDAFARQDERSAVAVYEQDNSIDKKHKELLKQTAKEMSEQKHDMQAWFDVLWAIRSLERIGDRCKNLCEYVLFLTYGKDVRHSSMKKTVKKLMK
ncbi:MULTISPECIES: phosphate signaling complex protein PhoU [Alteromonadaceae]|jgi:phosphate transport system protein|uniref:Phosphate-specific transport system accessory protein PhoU n=1 Tax=Brumicola blandensis TaxID=3075611 RepID=A0AAW8R4E9_9ALTE|nr:MULTISPECIES: phosphate signaling complex protein PhoU [unclassified Alteromonas]MDT0583237.1 phosphate signaling complex protein PhoU [Alteromonas sp. W409]MDT0627543.1 phosphate signaling complex protein PhoU [Alteromonas sp. W364]